MERIYFDCNGKPYRKTWKPGPTPKDYVSVHAEIPLAYLIAMKNRNAECGGLYPVNEQIRRAIYAYLLDGLVYTNPLKS